MQHILSQLIVILVVASFALFISQFVRGLLHAPQTQAIVETPVIESAVPVIEVVQSPVVPVISPVVYATLEWVHQVTEEAVNEMPDIVAMAKACMIRAEIAAMGIRELKKLASDRKLKGYSKLNKAQLIVALC
jgi:hypothetical protein